MVDFQVVRGLEGLKSLEARWRELAGRLPHRSFYHEYDWFRSYLESPCDTPSEPIFVMASTPDKTPLAIFPLQQAKTRKGGLALSSLRVFWPSDMEVNDFIMDGCLIDADLIHLLIRYLKRQHRLRFDILELQNVPERSTIAEAMKSHPRRFTVSVHRHCSKYIPLGKTYEETVRFVSGKFKRNLRRKLHKLERHGNVEYATYDAIADAERGYEKFIEVEANSWKGPQGTGTAILLNKQQTCFYRELMSRFARTHQSRIDVMTVSGRPVAAQLGLISGDTLHLLKIAYDEAYHSAGPGSLLLNRTLQNYSGHRHIRHVSFVTGAPWKDDWAPKIIKVYSHSIFSLTPLGLYGFLLASLKARLRRLKRRYAVSNDMKIRRLERWRTPPAGRTRSWRRRRGGNEGADGGTLRRSRGRDDLLGVPVTTGNAAFWMNADSSKPTGGSPIAQGHRRSADSDEHSRR